MASIYQSRKGGGWTAQVNIGGKRRSKTFPLQTDAKRWARQQEAQIDQKGTRIATAGDTSLNDLIEEYLTDCAGRASRSKLGAVAHISELLGRVKLADLTVARFRDFAAERAAEGAGPATIAQDLTYIHGVLTIGGALLDAPVAEALASYTAARKILTGSGRIARPKERTRRPTDGELIALRDLWAGRRRVTPMWHLTCFAICTAMRLSELAGLRLADLDREARTITIRDRKHPRSKQGNDQTVPLLKGPVTIAGHVIDPMEIIDAQAISRGLIFDHDPRTISSLFTRGVQSCEIEDLHFHDLRHDGVSRLFEAGYQVEQVALVSGHRDWQQLRRYTQIKAEGLHRD